MYGHGLAAFFVSTSVHTTFSGIIFYVYNQSYLHFASSTRLFHKSYMLCIHMISYVHIYHMEPFVFDWRQPFTKTALSQNLSCSTY